MIIYFFKILSKPLRDFTRQMRMKLGLKKRYPDLKLAGNVSISKTVFGSHNYIENAIVNNSIMGDFSYVGSQSYINRCTIGKFTCIGPNVKIGLGSHPASEFISVHPVFYSTAAQVGVTFSDKDYFQEYEDTHIGNDVWIGANAIVKSGVNVGDGAIIASGAVVTKDVAAYSVVGGIPSKLIKYRFEADEIKKLVDLKWWDHDSKWLKENYRLFHSIRNLNNLEW